jgi:hypothetical protein
MRTEREARSVGQGTNALASSIILVCRKREASAHADAVQRHARKSPGEFKPGARRAKGSGGKPVVFSAYTGGGSDGPKPDLAGYFDAPEDEPKVIEFEAYMEPRMSMTIRP